MRALLATAVVGTLLGVIKFIVSESVLFSLKKVLGKYHFTKQGTAKEAYRVIAKGNNYARLTLEKSSVTNSLGFIDITNTLGSDVIKLERRAFINTYSNALFFINSKVLNAKSRYYREKINTNEMQLDLIINSTSMKVDTIDEEIKRVISKKIYRLLKKKDNDCIQVSIKFDPAYAHLSDYIEQICVYAKGIGIIYSSLKFRNDSKIEYSLIKLKIRRDTQYWLPFNDVGNYWVYKILCTDVKPIEHSINK